MGQTVTFYICMHVTPFMQKKDRCMLYIVMSIYFETSLLLISIKSKRCTILRSATELFKDLSLKISIIFYRYVFLV